MPLRCDVLVCRPFATLGTQNVLANAVFERPHNPALPPTCRCVALWHWRTPVARYWIPNASLVKHGKWRAGPPSFHSFPTSPIKCVLIVCLDTTHPNATCWNPEGALLKKRPPPKGFTLHRSKQVIHLSTHVLSTKGQCQPWCGQRAVVPTRISMST